MLAVSFRLCAVQLKANAVGTRLPMDFDHPARSSIDNAAER